MGVLRHHIAREISTHIQSLSLLGLIESLTIGVRDHIDKETWHLFRDTGTGHLIAISGLHVGLIAGFFYYLSLYVRRCSALFCQVLPA